MSDLNQCQFIGRLGQNPEIRQTQSGEAVVNLSIAVSERYTNKQTGEKQEKTEWVRIVAFGKLAEIIGQYLQKGSQILVSGKLQTKKWTDNNGVERYTTEIIAKDMQMLSSPNNQQNSYQPQGQGYAPQGNQGQGFGQPQQGYQQNYQPPTQQQWQQMQQQPQVQQGFTDGYPNEFLQNNYQRG